MVTAYSAFKQMQSAVEKSLTDAGFIDGISLTNEQVKNESTPLFWFMQVTTKAGSEKPRYITYEIISVDPLANGDGDTILRRGIAEINFYSRDKNIDAMIDSANNKFVADLFNFEYSRVAYDNSNHLYNYTFIVKANIQ